MLEGRQVGVLEQGNGTGEGVESAECSLFKFPSIALGNLAYADFRRCCEISCLLCLSNAISDGVSRLGSGEVPSF